ncbi:unnamed protein product [Closterium sp. NIES-53]
MNMGSSEGSFSKRVDSKISESAKSGGAEPRGAASSGGPAGASPRLSPQQLRKWLFRRARLRSEAPGAGGAGVTAAAGGTGGTAAASPGGAHTKGAGVAGTGGVGGVVAGDPTEPGAARARGSSAGAEGAGDVDPGAGGAGGTVRPRPFFIPLLQQVLGVPSSTGLTPPLLCPLPDKSQPPLPLASPLLAPSPYTEQSSGLTERREPASRPVSPVRTARRVPHSRPPPVTGTHAMALRVPLPPPPESSLLEVPGPDSDRARAASPTVSRLLATTVTDPSFESAAASALVAELLDFAAACRLDYATALVAESACASPPSIGGECALGMDKQEEFECLAAAVPRFASMLLAPEGDPDAPDILTPRSYAEAITGPYSSQWQAAMDAEMESWKSAGTYVDEVPPPRANIVDGMWIFMVKRPSGSPPAFKARYVARGFSQQQGVDYFHTFSPTPKMTTLQWSLRRPVYGLRQAPREWHDTLRTTLAALGFAPATVDPSLFLRTDTSLPPFYVLVYVDDLVFATADNEALTLILQRFGFQFSLPQATPLSTSHSLSAPPLDESVEPSGPYPELVGCLITSGMGLVLGGRGLVVVIGHADTSWLLFEAEIYAGAMAAQELRSLTYLLNDLGEQPRSPPVLYVDNKAMIALCQEHRLEHRTKHIALRYFLARELQQRGQLRLAYVATRANTADVFTKALPPSDHRRFSTVLACFAFLDWSCDHLFSPTLPMGG